MSAGLKPSQATRLSARHRARRIGPHAITSGQPDQHAVASILSDRILAHRHDPAPLAHPVPAWVSSRPPHKMTSVSPPKQAAPMVLPYMLAGNVAKEVQSRR
jgi:hypothetical protein